MLRPDSNSCTSNDHNLKFEIQDATITVDEMGRWVANIISEFPTEHMQERFARDVAHTIFEGVARKVYMTKAQQERSRVRKLWVELHPPNHAGYYYCHIGGEWIHKESAELDHIIPSSVERINTDEPGWDDKLRMACSPHNYWKGSKQVDSVTLEIAPPDEPI